MYMRLTDAVQEVSFRDLLRMTYSKRKTAMIGTDYTVRLMSYHSSLTTQKRYTRGLLVDLGNQLTLHVVQTELDYRVMDIAEYAAKNLGYEGFEEEFNVTESDYLKALTYYFKRL